MRTFLNDEVGIEFDPTVTAVGTPDGILTIAGEHTTTKQDVPVRIFSNSDEPVQFTDADRQRLLGLAQATLEENGLSWAKPVSLRLAWV